MSFVYLFLMFPLLWDAFVSIYSKQSAGTDSHTQQPKQLIIDPILVRDNRQLKS